MSLDWLTFIEMATGCADVQAFEEDRSSNAKIIKVAVRQVVYVGNSLVEPMQEE
jgi:hypothetical protein